MRHPPPHGAGGLAKLLANSRCRLAWRLSHKGVGSGEDCLVFDSDRGRAFVRGYLRRQALALSAMALFLAALGVWILLDTGDWFFAVGLLVAGGLLFKGAAGYRRWTDQQFDE